jgi:predicted CoA-binding protein
MKSIAIVGASNDRAKFGNKAVRAFVGDGWQVFPVNPKETRIEGLPAYGSVVDLPVRPNLVSLYVPPAVGLQLLPDIAERGCDELWLNPGADSEELVAAAERLGLTVIQACSLVGHGLAH